MTQNLSGLPGKYIYPNNEEYGYLPPDSKTYQSSVGSDAVSYDNGGQKIEFLLPTNGLLDGDSLYLSYQFQVNYINVGTTAPGTGMADTVSAYMIGGYMSPFSSMKIESGSTTLETPGKLNITAHAINQLILSPSEKYGLSSSYFGSGPNIIDDSRTITELNCTKITNNAGTYNILNFSGPFNLNGFANANKAIPLHCFPQIKITLETENFINFLNRNTYLANNNVSPDAAGTGPVNTASYTLKNLQLHYTTFNPGAAKMQEILSIPKIRLKSTTISTTSRQIPPDVATGTYSLNFSVNLSSIRAIFVLFSASAKNAVCTNGMFDFLNPNATDFQLIVDGHEPIPSKKISVATDYAGVISHLRKAITTLYPYESFFDKSNNFSITKTEFGYTTARDNTNVTSHKAPSKFILGIHTSKVYSTLVDDIAYAGISTNGSQLTIDMNIANTFDATSLPNGITATLVCVHDLLYEIDNYYHTININR